ncbi:unnamed protein product [Moneuplotes crassus]|uniref:Uncharacterized protein n=1 Tax=Euplotes crassus TaxID=5936 RepID=A0AAD1XQY0_EUPCR|nr:unnamed protein product [Moneuplotes crassus]
MAKIDDSFIKSVFCSNFLYSSEPLRSLRCFLYCDCLFCLLSSFILLLFLFSLLYFFTDLFDLDWGLVDRSLFLLLLFLCGSFSCLGLIRLFGSLLFGLFCFLSHIFIISIM